MTDVKERIRSIDAPVLSPGDYQDPEDLFRTLIVRIEKYHPSDDLRVIHKAYEMAKEAHSTQKRKSGEPYIIHPLCVSIILADLELDKETIEAGLLHDVVEDTALTHEDVAQAFSEEVAQLVDGVSKLSKINYHKTDKVEMQADNLRKMFLAMAKDIRVILIKLADRLHNMRTLQYMRREKQIEVAQETLDIYSPIAERLGISRIKTELDDLCLKYLEPEAYYELVEKVNLKKSERDAFVGAIEFEIQSQLMDAGIEAQVVGRAKHFFSIYKKMVNQQKTIDQIYDMFAIRVIVKTVQDCYTVLGIIHELYKLIPGRFKAYIARPKENRYQSLHPPLIGPGGMPFELQIRTEEMHKTAEYGIAAHWKYKEASDGRTSSSDQGEAKLNWLRQILEWQRDMSDNQEFMSLLKSDLDLFAENVYCFSPAGDVKSLPNGSNTIDFAYSIHSAVGNRMVGARVNGKLVPIEYVIQNGAQVEIITSQNAKGPSLDWLKVVKSSQAKTKINQWFRKENKEENITRGRELLAQYAKEKNLNLPDYMKSEYMDAVMTKYGFKDWDHVLAAVGHGGLKEGQVVNKLIESFKKEKTKRITDEDVLEAAKKEKDTGKEKEVHADKTGIVVRGIHDVAVRFSKCCSPIPGDEIVGFITRGRGISIHRTDCVNVINMSDADRARLIDAEWQTPKDTKHAGTYTAEINIYAHNRTGLLIDISRIFLERNIDIGMMNVRTSKQGTATLEMKFEVHSTEELRSLIEKLRSVQSVIDIERKTGG